ncbi:hypothetical protein EVAR_45026_1 [Eumeta japonica]|uniref:Uncharacterized protein n=1 Tax=Eumeta variegata TaxID=151549 RepID=A0A4C1YL62_EUMVA|nr:hypothetical protein EVAR_45026_1 [Eumeta japonica]
MFHPSFISNVGPTQLSLPTPGTTSPSTKSILLQRVFLCYNALSVEVYTDPTIQCYSVSDWSYIRGGVCQSGPNLHGPLPHLPSGLPPTRKIVQSYLERNETGKFEKRLTTRPSLKLLAI